MKQQFLVDTAETFQTYVYERNRKIVPTSATLTVYKPAGDVLVVDGASMTIAPDGLLSYALGGALNGTPDENYRAVVSYVYSSTTYTFTLFYDVVYSRLVKVVTDEDVINELPQLKDNGWKFHGTAESGSSTTIVDSDLTRYEDGYFTGGLAYSIDQDETREVTGFDSSNGTVTTVAFSSAVSTDKYVLTRSFTKEIERAFEKIEDKLVRAGKRPHLILDPYDLREVHCYLSVAEVSKGLVAANDSFWWEMWKEYEKKGDETFNAINFKYDVSGDGYIAGSEESSRINIMRSERR